MSDGCAGCAGSIHGRTASTPPVSSATVTISNPCGCNSRRNSCHTGRSKRQPHQLAQATSSTFWPSSEQILRLIPEGAYFTYLKQSQSGLSKEFRPNPPVLAVPASAPVGRTWSWSITSSDGATKLDASFRVDRNETLTIAGEQVQTVVLAIVLKTSGDIELTTNQTNWVAPSKGLSVKVEENSNGRAGSITFSSQSSTMITSTKPS